MISRISLIIFLGSGIAMAVLVTVYPDITAFIGTSYRLDTHLQFLSKQSSLFSTGTDFSKKLGRDICSHASSEVDKEITKHHTSVRPSTSGTKHKNNDRGKLP